MSDEFEKGVARLVPSLLLCCSIYKTVVRTGEEAAEAVIGVWDAIWWIDWPGNEMKISRCGLLMI